MNNERRKAIAAIVAQLDPIRDQLLTLQEAIRDISSEETEAFENMPESLQQPERGQESERAKDYLDEAADTIDNFDFDELISQLDSAANGG